MRYVLITLFSLALNSNIEPSEVYSYIVEKGIEHPEIVYSQALLETGHFKCKNCSLKKNNLFGFRTRNGYISFSSWEESIDYYKAWQDRHYKGGNYYDFLNCLYKTRSGRCVRYATEPTYTERLKKVRSNLGL